MIVRRVVRTVHDGVRLMEHSKVHGTHQKWLTEHLQHFGAHTSFISKTSLLILFVFCCDVTPSCLILMGCFKSTRMTLRRTSQVYIKSKYFVFLRLLILILVQISKTSLRQYDIMWADRSAVHVEKHWRPIWAHNTQERKECKQIHGHFLNSPLV